MLATLESLLYYFQSKESLLDYKNCFALSQWHISE